MVFAPCEKGQPLVLTVMHLSLVETLRKRLLVAAGGLTFLFLLLFFGFVHSVGQPSSAIPDARYLTGLTYLYLGLFAAYVMIALFAVLIFVASVSAEIDDGTLLAVLPRPIRRYQVVLGKWMGLSLVVLAYVTVLYFGIVLIDQAQFGSIVRPPGFAAAYANFLLEGLLVGTVTLLGSTLTATMTNGIVVSSAVLTAFLGGSLEQLGTLTQSGPAFAVIGWITSFLIPSDSLYRRALFQLLGNHANVSAILNAGPFGAVHPPGEGMVYYALLYVAGVLMLAIWSFGIRDL